MPQTESVSAREAPERNAAGATGRGVWVFHGTWLLLGAGGALAFPALIGLLAPVTGGTRAARGASLAALLACAAAGLLAGRGNRGRGALLLAAAAIFLAVSPWVFPLLGPLGTLAWSLGHGIPFLLFALRVAAAIPAVAVPMVCLGAAFALLSREQGWAGAGRRPQALRLALLGAGASLGAANAGFRLLPWGGERAVALAGAILLLAAAVVSEAARRSAVAGETDPEAGEASGGGWGLARESRLAGYAALLWGFTATTLLLGWDRLLGLVFGPFPESMSRTAGVFLAGCALGALAVFLTEGVTKPGSAAIPLLAALLGIASAGTLYLADRLPVIYLSIAALSGSAPVSFALRSWGIAALLVLPAGIAFGALLPFLAEGSRERAGGKSGAGGWMVRILSGAFLAAVVMPVWVVPHLGFRSAIVAAGSLILAFSGVGFAFSVAASRLLRVAGILAAGTVTLFLVLGKVPGDPRLLSSGVHRYAREILERFQDDPAAYREARRKADFPFYREGGEATVGVERVEARVSPILALTVDGLAAGTTSYDLVPQILSAEIPMVIRPGARNVLLIGYGTGIGAGSLLLHPLESLDVAETEAAVVEASRRFEPANRSPRSDPRLKLYPEDPRLLLRAKGPGAYDRILCRATAPEAVSSRFLFTASFYRLAASRLRRGGLLAQALPLEGLSPSDLASVVRTARTAFGDVVLLQTYYHEALLLASDETIRFDLKSIQAAMDQEKILSDLGRIGLASPELLVVRHRLSGRGLDEFARSGRILTDGNAPPTWAGYRAGTGPVAGESVEAFDRFSTGLADRIAGAPEGAQGDALLLRIARAAVATGDSVRAADLAEALLARGDAADAHQILGDAHYLRMEQIPAVAEWHKALEADPKNVNALKSLAGFSSDRQNYSGAEQYLRAALEVDPSEPEILFHHGRALYYLKRLQESEADLVKALLAKGESGAPLALYYLGLIQKEKGNLFGASEFLGRYLRWAYQQGNPTPMEVEVHLALAEIYSAMGFTEPAEEQKKAGEALRKRLEERVKSREKALLEMLAKP